MNKNLAFGTILSYFNIILSILIGFITAPIILKQLGESEYGVYQMVLSMVSYMSILDFGLHNVTTRFVSKYRATNDDELQRRFLGTNILLFGLIMLLILIVGAVIYVNLGTFFSNSMSECEISLTKRLFVILTVNLAISMPGAVFAAIVVAYEKFIFSRFLTTMKMIVRMIFVLLLVNFGLKATGLVVIDFLINIAIIAVNMMFCFSKLKIKILLKLDKTLVKTIFSFSIFVFVASITEQINWKVDTVLIGASIGTSAVTLHSISAQLTGYFKSFSGAISGVFLPKATKMVALNKSNAEITDLMISIGRAQLIICGVVLFAFSVLGKEFLTLWIGESYIINYYWFLTIGFSLLVPMTQSVGINVLEAKFMHQFRALVYFGISVVNIVISLILINYIGVWGAVLGTVFSMIIGNNIVINIYYHKKVGLNIIRFFKETYLKIFPVQILVTMLLMIVFYFVPICIGSWWNIIIKGLIFVFVYFGSIYFFALNGNEKALLKSFLEGRN